MEYNPQNNQEDKVVIREQGQDSSFWYIIIGILVLVLVGWYGYSAGWFSARDSVNNNLTPMEQNDGVNTMTPDGMTPENAAPIDSIMIEQTAGFPVGQILVVKGTLPNGCVYLNDPVQMRDGNVFYVTLQTRTEGEVCTEALVPYEERIPLQVNNLPAGVYIVNINGREISFELENDNALDFNAGSDK